MEEVAFAVSTDAHAVFPNQSHVYQEEIKEGRLPADNLFGGKYRKTDTIKELSLYPSLLLPL